MNRKEEINIFLGNIGVIENNKLSELDLININSLNEESYNTLTSENAINAYRAGVKFSELASIVHDKQKFTILTNPKFALLCYQAGAKFADMNNVANNPNLAAAINDLGLSLRLQGLAAFKAGVSFADLLSVVDDQEKFNTLTSENAINAYQAGVKFSELNKLYLQGEHIGNEVMERSNVTNQQIKNNESKKIAEHITSLCKTKEDYKSLSTACKKSNKKVGNFSSKILNKTNIPELIVENVVIDLENQSLSINSALLKKHVTIDSITNESQKVMLR